MGALILAAVFLVFVIAIIAAGVRIVPQGNEYVVERLGKFHRTLQPGLSLLIPLMDRVAYKVPTKDIILDIPQQEVITKDNAVVMANAVAFVKVTGTEKAVYGVEDYSLGITNLVQTSLRSIIGAMNLDESLSSRDRIKAHLKTSIADDVAEWGLTLKSVEIQDIMPSETMQTSMELQAAAERERKATITKAEGEKQAVILEAEGNLEAAKLEAEAQIALAQSSAKAIHLVTAGIGDKEFPATFLLGEKYITAMKEMAVSDNAKTVVLPADVIQAVQTMLAKK